MTVGKRIKEIRKKKKLTLRELSKKADISISFISDIENGRSNPSLERLKSIAAALDTPVSVLLGESVSDEVSEKGEEGLFPAWLQSLKPLILLHLQICIYFSLRCFV